MEWNRNGIGMEWKWMAKEKWRVRVRGRAQGGLEEEGGEERHLMGFRWGLVPDLPEDHLSLLIFPR